MVVDKKKIKVYIVGGGNSNASWLNSEIVNTIEEADLVLFTGGEDVNPQLYGQATGRFTHFNKERDQEEWLAAEKAVRLGKNIFGICRGAQFGCVYNGGQLVQHMNHPHQHNLTLYDGTKIVTNSVHHQLQKPFNLHPAEYSVIGWAKGLSNVYLNGNNDNSILPSVKRGDDDYSKEPEIVYYRKSKWLGIQGHPEWMGYNSDMCKLMRAMVDLMIQDRLDIVLTMDIPTKRYIDKPLELFEDELIKYESILKIRKSAEIDLVN